MNKKLALLFVAELLFCAGSLALLARGYRFTETAFAPEDEAPHPPGRIEDPGPALSSGRSAEAAVVVGDPPVSNGIRRLKERAARLRAACWKYTTDPFRPESVALKTPATRLGSEVVYLEGRSRTAAVCVPHKVGSHSWGRYAAEFNRDRGESLQAFMSLDFRTRARRSLRAVVVRHPLERLVSVYRMIFEGWCDPGNWLRGQWKGRVCTQSPQGQPRSGRSLTHAAGSDTRFDTGKFLESLMDEYKHGNDRFIQHIWDRFRPGESGASGTVLKRFTFKEFVRFVVNGSVEFSGDPAVDGNKGLCYHWAPYWSECSLCNELTSPEVVLHLETLDEDLMGLVDLIGGRPDDASKGDGNLRPLFPHTHVHQDGSLSSDRDILRKHYATLTRGEILQLYDKYRLDHDLFGFSPEEFFALAATRT